MKRQSSSSKQAEQRVATLTVFIDEDDSQQSLQFDLKKGENLIGKNAAKCSIVCTFSSEIDEVNTKITVEDEEYSLEDQGSKRGTFKIKSDNSLIRLKPFKSYDLQSPQAFYIGRFRCVFRCVMNSRSNNFAILTTPISSQAQSKKTTQIKRMPSMEDDIEDFFGSTLKRQPSKNEKQQEEAKQSFKESSFKDLIGSAPLNKPVNSKTFVKSKGQLAKSTLNASASISNSKQIAIGNQEINEKAQTSNTREQPANKRKPISSSLDRDLVKMEEEEDNEELLLLGLKSKTAQRVLNAKKRSLSQIMREMEAEEEEEKNIPLNSQFLRRIEEKLKKPTAISESKDHLAKLAVQYSSQKKKSQDIRVEEELSNSEKEEDVWKPTATQIVKKGKGVKESKEKSTDSKKLAGKKVVEKEEKVKATTKKAAKIESKKSERLKKAEEIAAVPAKVAESIIKTDRSLQSTKSKKSKVVPEEQKSEVVVAEKKSLKKGTKKENEIKQVEEIIPEKKKNSKNAQKTKDVPEKELKVNKSAKKQVEILSTTPKKSIRSKSADIIEIVSKKNETKEPIKVKKENPAIRRTKPSKKEVLNLHNGMESAVKTSLEMPRRNQYRVLLSNCNSTDEDLTRIASMGARVVQDIANANDFNILVTDELKRRLKTLVALNRGYPIVSSSWVKACVKSEKILPVEKHLLSKVDSKFSKTFGFNLSTTKQNHEKLDDGSLFKGVSFACSNSSDINALKAHEIKLLVESAGGSFREVAQAKADYWIEGDVLSDQKIEGTSTKKVHVEGLLQSCLLQENILDNYEIQQPVPTRAPKKK